MELQIPSLPIFFTFFTLIFVALKVGKRSKTKKSGLRLPPGPWKLPVIGNMHNLIVSLPHKKLRDLANIYGPLMHLQLGEISTLVVSSPEAAKEVMKTHDVIFASRPSLLVIDVLGYGSTNISYAPYGDYWRQLRKISITELLSTRRVQSFRSIREEEVSNLIRSISSRAGSTIDLSKEILSLTFSIVSKAAFGKKYNDQEEFISLVKETKEITRGFSVADVFPSLKFLHSIGGMRSKLDNLRHKFDIILENIIDKHKSSQETGEGEMNQDLLQVLLNLQKHGDLQFPLTNDNIKSVILDIFIGGGETSATSVEWAMSEMLKNPKVMEKAQAEVRNVFGINGNVDETGLQELKYLKMVLKETLRLHPPGPLLLPRESRERCEIFGYEIPIKTRVMINAWAIGRDPRHWSEAERFYPERFLDNPIDYKGTDFEFIPFGAGRRVCPGISFGMVDVELPLAQLLYHFDWKLPNGAKQEELDMTEAFGSVVRRKKDLYLIPSAYRPLQAE